MSEHEFLNKTPENDFLAEESFESSCFNPQVTSTDNAHFLRAGKKKQPRPALGESTNLIEKTSEGGLDGLSFGSTQPFEPSSPQKTAEYNGNNSDFKENSAQITYIPECPPTPEAHGYSTLRLSQLLSTSKLDELSKMHKDFDPEQDVTPPLARNPFVTSQPRENFADLAKPQSTPSAHTQAKKYIHGDFHAYRDGKSENRPNIMDSFEMTPIRKAKGHVVTGAGDIWSSTLSSETSQKTQIELDSKYFRPAASKETELTGIFGGFGLAQSTGSSSSAQSTYSAPKPDFSIVNSRSGHNRQDELGLDDSDFLSGDAALQMLDEHEAEFEEENRLRLDSNYEANEELNQQDFSIRSNDGNISKFFAAGNGGLGLGDDDSPTKSAFKKPVVPIAYGGASETVVIDKNSRRDTVKTVRSMNFSTLDSTAAFDKYHQDLKALDSDSSSESFQKIKKQHEKLRADETLGSIHGSSNVRQDRYSIGSLTSENFGKTPRSQSSPSKSSDSTNLQLDSFESLENTNVDELCRTKCGSFVTLCSKNDDTEVNSPEKSDTIFQEKTVSTSVSKGSLLTKQRRSSVTNQNSRTTRFASLPSIPKYDSMNSHVGTFQPVQHAMAPLHSAHCNPQFNDNSRPYSPAPLVEISNEVDFTNFVFTGDSKTEIIQIRPQNNWISCRFVIRSILLDSKPIPFEESPFVLREVEFKLTHGQPVFVPISFRPKLPGRYLSVLELRSSPTGQYQNHNGGQKHPTGINHQEQISAVNIIGLAVKPSIKIDNGSGMYRWEENGKNRIDLENTSEFNIPIIVEIDRGFDLILDGSPVNKITLPARTSVPLQLAPANDPSVQSYDSAKLKVYLDGREKTAIEFCTITRPPPVVQLSGPDSTPSFKVHCFSSSNEQIVIHNCGDCSANINAIIDGPIMDSIKISPGTASIPADGELVFSLKIVGESRLARSTHKLILEISGTDEEFVCPFDVTVLDQFDHSIKSARPSQQQKTRTSLPNRQQASTSSSSRNQTSSISSGPPTSLSSNRSILLWPKLARGKPESKSVTLRGRGNYSVNLSDDGFKVFMNDKQLRNGDLLKFSLKKDMLLQVRSDVQSDADLFNAKLNLVSVDDSSLKSCIPLVAQVGNPIVTINGETDVSKHPIPITFGKGSSMLLKNTGTAEAFVHFLQAKNSEKGLVEPQVFSLQKGEEKRIVFTTSKTSGSEEIMMYSGSARLREIMATILETEKGAAAWKKTLGKLNSAKITRLNFGHSPNFDGFENLGILPENYVSVFNTFLRHLTVDTIEVKFKPISEKKKTHTRTSSLDSVPTKETGQKENPTLVCTPSLLDLSRENELTVMANGITRPVLMTCQYDESVMRVAPTRLELQPHKREKIIVIPLKADSVWVQSLLLKTDMCSQSVGVQHLGTPRNELVFSQNLVDFGSVDGKLPVNKKVSMTNKDADTVSWFLIQQSGKNPDGRFSLFPRDGELKPGQSIELTIKFAPPRVPNEYEQDWLIEYHKKGEVGLARTMRRISLKTKAATKLMKTFELKPSTGEFANVLPNTGTMRTIIQLQNKTYSPMNITAGVAKQPFADKQRSFTLKPRYYIDFPVYLNTNNLERRLYESEIAFTNDDGFTQVLKLRADLS